MAMPALTIPSPLPARQTRTKPQPQRRPLQDRARERLRHHVLKPLDASAGCAIRLRRNANRDYRPVFVAGGMGCGTTLLALSLWQRFDVAAAIRESVHEIARSSFLHGPPAHDFESIAAYEASLMPSDDWSTEQGRADLHRMYRSYASGPSRTVIDKGPNANLVRARFLAECFPEGHFVMIFRDPVAAIEGFMRKWPPFERDGLDASIDFYERIHERFIADTWDLLPERVTVVQYERLVEKTDEMMNQLGIMLGLAPAHGKRSLEQRPNVAGCGIRNVASGRIRVVPDANQDAYGRMAPADIDRVQRRLGPLYRRLRLASI
jgi:hypothetical protein